jgi:predicted DCC family thiol-disulfide oxidoreductase YuxK
MSWVLFFDGECAFCSASVQQVMRLDKRRRVSFAPLQGKLAADSGFARYASETNGTMVLLRESDGKVFIRSDALFELARALGGAWRILLIGRIIPNRLRDLVYRWLANHRYLFLGKSKSCSLPDPEMLKRLRD